MSKKVFKFILLFSIVFGLIYRIVFSESFSDYHYKDAVCDICGKTKKCVIIALHKRTDANHVIVDCLGNNFIKVFNICSDDCHYKFRNKYITPYNGEYGYSFSCMHIK